MCKIVQSCCLFFLQNKTTKASKRTFRGIKRACERALIVSIRYTILQISKLLPGDMVKLSQPWAYLEVRLGVHSTPYPFVWYCVKNFMNSQQMLSFTSLRFGHRQVQKSDRINSDHQSGSDQLGSTRTNSDRIKK